MRSGRAHSRFTIGFRVHVLLLVQQSWFPIFFFDNLGSPSQDLGSTWHETKPNQGAHGMSSLKRIHFIIDSSFMHACVIHVRRSIFLARPGHCPLKQACDGKAVNLRTYVLLAQLIHSSLASIYIKERDSFINLLYYTTLVNQLPFHPSSSYILA